MRYCVVQRCISRLVYHTFKLVVQFMREGVLKKTIISSYVNINVKLKSSLFIFEIIAKHFYEIIKTYLWKPGIIIIMIVFNRQRV